MICLFVCLSRVWSVCLSWCLVFDVSASLFRIWSLSLCLEINTSVILRRVRPICLSAFQRLNYLFGYCLFVYIGLCWFVSVRIYLHEVIGMCCLSSVYFDNNNVCSCFSLRVRFQLVPFLLSISFFYREFCCLCLAFVCTDVYAHRNSLHSWIWGFLCVCQYFFRFFFYANLAFNIGRFVKMVRREI